MDHFGLYNIYNFTFTNLSDSSLHRLNWKGYENIFLADETWNNLVSDNVSPNQNSLFDGRII